MKFLGVPPRYRSHTESKCSWKKSGFIRLTALKADFDDILAGFRGILLSVTNPNFTRIYQDLQGLDRICQVYTDLPRYMSDPTFCLFSWVPKSDVYHEGLSSHISRFLILNCSINDQKWPKGQFLWWRHKLNGAYWYFRNSLLAQKWFEFNHQCTNRNIHES